MNEEQTKINHAYSYGSFATGGYFLDSFGNLNCCVGGQSCGDDFSLWLRNTGSSYWFCPKHLPNRHDRKFYKQILNIEQAKIARELALHAWQKENPYRLEKKGGRMALRFFKDGDTMGLQTDCETEPEFIDAFASSLEAMIAEGKFENDWHFQLNAWLPQFVDIVCAYRGYKSADIKKSVVLTAGSLAEVVFEKKASDQNKPMLNGFAKTLNL